MKNLTRFVGCNGENYVLCVYKAHTDAEFVRIDQEIERRIEGVITV